MATLKRAVEMLERTKNGPDCTVKDWERTVIPQTVRDILKKHDLQKKYNAETPVNQDLELADRYFEAGLDLAATIGCLCIDTEKIIELSREEILAAAEEAPAEITLGEGDETCVLRAREIEDPIPPLYASTLAITVTEDHLVPLTAGIIKSRNVHILSIPSIDTVFGAPVYGGTPFEAVAGLLENRSREEALKLAGRQGMPTMGTACSTTEYGHLAGFPGQTRRSNRAIGICLQPAELKTNFASFYKVVSTIGYGGYVRSGCPTMIGGYSGSAEGAAVSSIASDLIQYTVNQAHISGSAIFDVRNNSSVGSHCLWSSTIALQGRSRNTHLLGDKIVNQKAGPCTENILYTCAAGLIAQSVSGVSHTLGPRSGGGSFKDYLSPLESWWCGDVFKATGGLALGKANELVLHCLSKYEDTLKDQPKGKKFTDCFDLETLEPTAEWKGIHDRVREDMIQQGLPLG